MGPHPLSPRRCNHYERLSAVSSGVLCGPPVSFRVYLFKQRRDGGREAVENNRCCGGTLEAGEIMAQMKDDNSQTEDLLCLTFV